MLSKVCFIVAFTICAATDTSEPCDKIKFGDKWYDRQVFWPNLGRPYNVHIHKASNMLFFSYSLLESYSEMDFRLGFYNLNTKEFSSISGVTGGCSVAIDQMYDDIYFGGSDGIYKYNSGTKYADFYKEKGKNIWSLFFKKNLFYISYPEQKLHIEYEGRFSKVSEFENIEIDNFHISSGNIIYYANKSGLFRYNSEKMKPELIVDLVIVRQIVEDNDEDTYVCTNTGIFISSKTGFKKILDAKNVYGLTFDVDNNIIYSDDQNIVRLKYNATGCEDDNVLLE